MKFNWNLWDITRSLSLIVVILFVCYNGQRFLDTYHNNVNKVLIEKTEIISDQAAVIRNLQADNKEAIELLKKFKEEKSVIVDSFEKQKKETLSELGQVKAELKKTRNLRVASDKIYNKETQDQKFWYFFKKITLKNKEGKDIPVAWAMFYPYQTSDKQWKVGTYDLNVDVKVLESENRDGSSNRYAEVNLFDKDNNQFPVKVKSIAWEKVELKDKHMSWWNPRVGFGSTFTSADIAPKLDFSIASYGKTKVDMDWRFLTIGIGMTSGDNSKLIGSFEPFSWNAGKALPLVENIFVGPTITYDTEDSDIKYGLSISIPF